MGYTVTCTKCNEINSGYQINCTKCQTSLAGVRREKQPTTEEPIPIIPQITKGSASLQPKKSFNKIWAIVAIAIAGLCLVTTICLVMGVISLGKVSAEKAPIESVLDSYMKYMVSKDIESAYALFAPRFQRQISISEVQELIEGNNYILYEGYQNLSVENINLTASANTNPDLPQGTVARVNGTINYEGGFQGTFEATLEKVDSIWRLDGIHVTVSPDKFDP